jgi:creatinine amidohydrolase
MYLWRLQELTYKVVREQNYQVAILPVGSTEAHGLHVPYGSDAFHSTALADRVCAKAWETGARVVLLPTIPYGVQSNTLSFPLNINVYQATLDAVVSDIVRSLEHHGIHKCVIFNGHGGNNFRPLLRQLYGRTNVFVSLVNWWEVGSDRASEIFEHPGEHADEMETSVDLALFGNLVHLDDAGDGSTNPSRFEAINRGWVTIARPWHLLTKDSTYGDPRKASKEKGEAYITLVVERVAQFIVDLAKAEMDERFPY